VIAKRRDPYLEWAEANNFACLAPAHAQGRYGVMFETNANAEANNIARRIASDGVLCAVPHHPSRYWSALLTRDGIKRVSGWADTVRLELAHPLAPHGAYTPRRAWRDAPLATADDLLDTEIAETESYAALLAVIDDVCPFAHHMLRQPNYSNKSRLAAWWDQNEHSDPHRIGYGCVINQSSINNFLTRNAPIKSGADEHSCYEDVGYLSAASARSHGAHSWAQALGTHSSSGESQRRLLHVQYATSVLDIPSNAAMCRNTLDGVRWVLSQRKNEPRVVISIGYVSPLGPHDNSSIFAKALAEEVDWWRKHKGVSVSIVFASGNDYETKQHARIPKLAANKLATLLLRVPPSSKTNTFVEVWVPESFDERSLSVVAPNETRFSSGAPMLGAHCDVIATNWTANAVTLILVRISPTHGGSAAEYGDWRIEIKSTSAIEAPINAYVSRASGSIGTRVFAYQARWVAARNGGVNFVDSEGTLSGMACGDEVFAIGGYHTHDKKPARYTAAGPTRDARKTGPQYSMATEDSAVRHGVRGAGNRSGITFRMNGTSVAAPKFAAKLAGPAPSLPPTGEDPRLGKQL
jgi:hypothetical protein